MKKFLIVVSILLSLTLGMLRAISFANSLLTIGFYYDSVVLNYSTDKEMGIEGINIWRSEKKFGQYIKLNLNVLGEADESPDFAGVIQLRYSYIDDTVLPCYTYFYRIEKVYKDKYELIELTSGPIITPPCKSEDDGSHPESEDDGSHPESEDDGSYPESEGCFLSIVSD